MVGGIDPELREQYQREAVAVLTEKTEFPVAAHDDSTLIEVYINEERGTFKSELMPLGPYYIKTVHPLGDDDRFPAVAFLTADWSQTEEWGED